MAKSKELRMVFGWNFGKNKPQKLQDYFGGEWVNAFGSMKRCAFRFKSREFNEGGGGYHQKQSDLNQLLLKVSVLQSV